MSKGMEGNQRTPSVIAKLMGLDELAPQQPLHRQQKVLSDDYLRKTASIGQLEKRSLRDVHLSKISAGKQEKYFNDSEISNDKQIIRPISDESSNPSMVRADFSFSRQRNSHTKYLSKDKKLFHLKGLDDVPGDLHANNSLGYYHHPDLSIKQIGDPKELQPQLHSGRLPASMSTSISDESDSEVCKKLDKMTTQRIALRSPQKRDHNSGQIFIDLLDNLKSQSDLTDRSTYYSRRIVVLKPNSRQARNSAMNLLMPKSSILGELNIEGPETADATSVMEPPRHSFGVKRGVPKQTQVVKKNTCSSSFEGFPRSTVPTGKSSLNVTEKKSCQSSFDCMGRDRISYPFPSGSLFAMEAKKKIFERWKSTKSFQDVQVDGRRCTLGEMFFMHDGGVRSKTSYVKICQFSHEGKTLDLGSPLRVSNKYGSKDKYIPNLPRLELFKSSSIAAENSDLMTIGGASLDGLCLEHQDTATEDSNSLKNKASQQKDSLEPKDPSSSHEKEKCSALNAAVKVSHNIDQNTVQDVLDFDWDKDMNGEAEHSPIIASNLCTNGLVSVNASLHSKAEALFSSDDQLLEIAHSILSVEDDHAHGSPDVWENYIPQRSSFDSPRGELSSSCTTDRNFTVNQKEINQSSPNSVLEPSFKESEFYDGPLADLSGLALKLELLNSKSEETNSECSGMNVSSDEDDEKGSAAGPQYDKKLWGMSRPEESRDFSYLVDVLDEDNLCDRNLDNLLETWLSMEFPVNSSLFEALEKKYGKQTSWLKSDRRLLFDRINSGLKEILATFIDIQTSAKPLRRRSQSTLRRDEIEEELWMLLINQEKEVSKDLSEKALGREMKWLELEEDISIICREIEEVLFNELAAELD